MKTVTMKAFVKAVDAKYFEAFLNGEICMNSLECFRKFESENPAIGDKYEGAYYAISKGATIHIAPCDKPTDTKWIFNDVRDVLIYKNDIHYNILSLYAIYDIVNGIHYIPKKFIDDFCHHRFCLIRDHDSFISRLENEILKQGFTPWHGLVKYFEPVNRGKYLNPLQKRNRYSYQNEARVFFENTIEERKIFNIGPIYDIANEINLEIFEYVIKDSHGNELVIMQEP